MIKLSPAAPRGASTRPLKSATATPGVLRVIAASGEGGLQLFSIDGRKLGQHDNIEAGLVDVLDGFYPQTPLTSFQG